MTMHFSIITDPETVDTVTVHADSAKASNIENGSQGSLCFGTRRHTIRFQTNSIINKNEMAISLNCFKELGVPEFIKFDLKVEGDNLIIGPYVGLLIGASNKRLLRKLPSLLNYTRDYQAFGGAVMAFSIEGMKPGEINGFLYNPDKNEWQEYVGAFPAAIYKKVLLTKKVYKLLSIEEIQPKIFNSHTFSKWSVYKRLAGTEGLMAHLPHTVLYKKPIDVIRFIDKHGKAFLKPIRGSKGRNIKEIKKMNNHFLVRYQKDRRNVEMELKRRELLEYLHLSIKKKPYVIQKALEIVYSENRAVDFRVFTLKDSSGKWQYIGWVGRSGRVDSIVSNRSSGGTVEDGDLLLNKIVNSDSQKASDLKKEIINTVLMASESFNDSAMNFGYFAIDIAVDHDGRVWILEMNHRYPNDGLPLYIGDHRTYRDIKLHIMLYLKYLAGFSKES
ncbi:YheC/YheD family endospore coat-associated protein [Peribacillus deserti]|uniref:ATP-grasp domain-containing protein n=1 Tax=Peribacillus deserti TaxID=673318 RepID=A0A2N5M0B4_9BACI|nr:YheC/YheD family protein [Peribacillus deserti]PLT27802.1 hypothetical protein CUU66_22080 [Peribacillus deserti]